MARLPLLVVVRGTWLFGLACLSFLVIQTLHHHPVLARLGTHHRSP